jgi:hypothetical protein
LNQIVEGLRELNKVRGVFMADPATACLLEVAA